MHQKKCSKCRQIKDLSEFHVDRSRKDGKQSYCKVCNSNNAKRNYKTKRKKQTKESAACLRKRLKKFVDDIKQKHTCQICGESDICCLDFHHIRGSKDADISHLVRIKSKKRLISELSKCTILCSNCHRKVHAGHLSSPRKPINLGS